MNDNQWNGHEGLKHIGNAILVGLCVLSVAIVIHGC